MSDDIPFAARRGEMLDRAVATLSTDARFPAGWLEGSLADGSGDAYSDIDCTSPWSKPPGTRCGIPGSV